MQERDLGCWQRSCPRSASTGTLWSRSAPSPSIGPRSHISSFFAAFAALLSRFGTFRQRAEADLRRTHDQLRVERPKLGSRTIALLYFAFSSCWILFTDPLVHGLGLSNAYVLELSEAKGILFISL